MVNRVKPQFMDHGLVHGSWFMVHGSVHGFVHGFVHGLVCGLWFGSWFLNFMTDNQVLAKPNQNILGPFLGIFYPFSGQNTKK